jgi:peptidoglycan/LPS O-acetylase OafA/YrhL
MLLWLLNQMGVRAIVLPLIGAVVLRIGFYSFDGNAHSLSYWTIVGRIDQFLIGMLLAVRFLTAREAPSSLLWPAACMGILLLLFGYNRAGGLPADGTWKLFWPTVEGLAWAAFILGYLHLAPWLAARVSRALASVGEVSFSMYLLHVGVISAVLQLGPPTFGLGAMGAAIAYGVLLVLPLTVGLSWITYRLIERPFLRMRVGYLIDRSPRASSQRRPVQ